LAGIRVATLSGRAMRRCLIDGMPRGGTNRQLNYFLCSGPQSLKDHPIMDKVLSLLISVSITTLGAWVVTATIIKGWPFAWALLALFPLLTGIISLSGSIKAAAD
jgi:hypothetical protein